MTHHIKDILDIGPNCYERFIDSEVLAEIKPLEITLAGCSNLSGRYSVGRTAPLEHTLFYTIKGQGKLTTIDKEIPLLTNTLAILPTKQSFEVSIDADQWDIIWLNLANTKRWQHLTTEPARVINNQKLEPLHFAMEILYSEPDATMRQGVFPLISHYLNAALLGNNQNKTNTRLHNLFQDIEKRLQFDWTIEAMCDQVHYSPPHLHRLCQSQYGKSPIQKLIYIRVERAKSLLLNTSWSVQHIASYVGYTSIFNFSKSFKKVVGVSPSEFRLSNTSQHK
ncbi:AraC family transcriptional regulator [uncultured Paraglaciecola sp.]|jgi:AraC-like DNA-binding protein|uniref:AraC family transcriptional regulator n=1 Tax=uncultured Paraglaciecola sp. TaxID=1765024 RepID=UPI0025EDCD1C|nr:AraC family transcriptional regulator [uncultured Paraglaciecola sp.]